MRLPEKTPPSPLACLPGVCLRSVLHSGAAQGRVVNLPEFTGDCQGRELVVSEPLSLPCPHSLSQSLGNLWLWTFRNSLAEKASWQRRAWTELGKGQKQEGFPEENDRELYYRI